MALGEAFYRGYTGIAFAPEPDKQFEACQVLRADGWSFIRIASALGLSLSQVRVACDDRAGELHRRWAA